jgi:hypothetical protein
MNVPRYRFRAASLLGAAFATLILASAVALADDLTDYGGDYTDAIVVPLAPLETNYRVGRGYVVDGEADVAATGAAAGATSASEQAASNRGPVGAMPGGESAGEQP